VIKTCDEKKNKPINNIFCYKNKHSDLRIPSFYFFLHQSFFVDMDAYEMKQKVEKAKVDQLKRNEEALLRHKIEISQKIECLTNYAVEEMLKSLTFPYKFYISKCDFQDCAEGVALNLRNRKFIVTVTSEWTGSANPKKGYLVIFLPENHAGELNAPVEEINIVESTQQTNNAPESKIVESTQPNQFMISKGENHKHDSDPPEYEAEQLPPSYSSDFVVDPKHQKKNSECVPPCCFL
jgi:hypothetical protein